MEIKKRIQEDVKAAMKAKDKPRLDTLRQISAAFKQREVDERIDIDDALAITILDKLAKQRRESIEQYEAAGRDDLVAQEQFELEVIKGYLPQPLSAAEIDLLIAKAIDAASAASIKDMGKVMSQLKPEIQGRADMSAVSALVKTKLGS